MFMKKKLNALMLFCIFITCLLVGCSEESNRENKTYNFVGASKHWEVKYILNQDSDIHRQEEKGFLTYKGKDVKNLGTVKYKIEIQNGISNGTLTDTEGRIRVNSACGGCAFHNKETPIRVTVEWNDQKETFELEYQKPGS
jgi:hypothetical protein